MRGEEIEAPVVHIGQELGGALDGGLAIRRPDRDLPRLPAAGNKLVAERRERQRQFLIVPRHENIGVFTDELMVPEQSDARAEPSPQVLGDRDLQQAPVLPGFEPAALPRLAALERFEEHGLAGEAAVDEQARGPSDGDRGGFREDEQRQARGSLLARNEKIEAVAANGAEIVLGLVDETIGPGFESLNGHGGPPVRAVLRRPAGGLGAFPPEAEDIFRGEGRFPARPQSGRPASGTLRALLESARGGAGRPEGASPRAEGDGRRARFPFPALGVPLRSARVIVKALSAPGRPKPFSAVTAASTLTKPSRNARVAVRVSPPSSVTSMESV